jgi:hypothetical protein
MGAHAQQRRVVEGSIAALRGRDAVLLGVIAAGGVGLLLGLWFRAPAMIAISGLAAATSLPIALTDEGLWFALLMTVALLTALQFGYLTGLTMALAWTSFHDHQWRIIGHRGEPQD